MEELEKECIINEVFDTYLLVNKMDRFEPHKELKKNFVSFMEFILSEYEDELENTLLDQYKDEIEEFKEDYYGDSQSIEEIEREEYENNVINPQVNSWRK